MSEFKKVATVGEIEPGKGKTVLLGAREIALFNLNGEFFALDNCCPHAGGPLGEGPVEKGQVVCPWHYWTFDIKNGKLGGSDEAGICVPVYEVRVDGEDVLVKD